MRVLVVEDESRTASYLSNGLVEKGFVVDVASKADEGYNLVCSINYDVVILDIGLPGMSGLSMLRQMRESAEKQCKNMRVIFLSARSEVQDRVRGLELGADDYMVKPFSFSELLVRLDNLMRRSPCREPDMIEVADLQIDRKRQVAKRSGKSLNLTAREFTLLVFLARRRGHVQTRRNIEEHVWNLDFDSETNVVDSAIRRLRKKVDEPFEQNLIHTIRGVGYVFEDRIH